MLRSGLPIVRPRIRGNKHALGHTHGEDDIQFDVHTSGSKTLPKIRAPPPPHAPPPLPMARNLERHHSATEIENNQNQNNIDENPIPLPPRDRSKTLQAKNSLPRHQRKHPLIIPGGGVTRTLAKMQVTTPPAEDQIDGHFPIQNSSGPGTSQDYILQASSNSPEEFEQRIDSQLAALDSLPQEDNRFHRCSVISEDLLEFSDNLIECDVPGSRHGVVESNGDNVSVELLRKVSIESRNSSKSTTSKCNLENFDGDNSGKNTPNSSKSEEKVEEGRRNSSIVNPIRPSNFTMQDCFNEGYSQNSDNPRKSHTERSSVRTSDLSRQSDHVSCEDLLEFACDGPNARRTRGPRNGEQSDEVRIMMKVLHEQSTPESCVAALNVTDWDVLAAIKLERLQSLLKKENNFVGLEDCKVMLNQCGGDVVKAAALLRNTEDTAAV
ncbi:activated Cdc42 kinase-like [Prorops nasuta]|uniref:activated Cdc42 kinase-like n=1 Tax=Prorops nasuta TaxID=863751 RepID=UPI0034CFF8C4